MTQGFQITKTLDVSLVRPSLLFWGAFLHSPIQGLIVYGHGLKLKARFRETKFYPEGVHMIWVWVKFRSKNNRWYVELPNL